MFRPSFAGVRACRSLLLLVLALTALALPGPARATQIDVTTTSDESNADGDCSLREAIRAASLNTAQDGCRTSPPRRRQRGRAVAASRAT